MGAENRSRRQALSRLLIAAFGSGVVGAVVIGAQGAAPDSPFKGRLARAVFLSGKVGEALAELAPAAPAASRTLLTEAAARAAQAEPALAVPAAPDPAAAARLARRRALAQGMVALVATPEARAESVGASEALVPVGPPPVGDAQGIGVALERAELAESYLKAHRGSAVTPYLYGYLMVQYRLAFERQTAAGALEPRKASAKKYRVFRQRALAAPDPLVKAVAEDIDAQLYLERATPEHPRNFDPDACCRDK